MLKINRQTTTFKPSGFTARGLYLILGKEVIIMKYIQNNGRYALAFEIVKDNRNVKINFDRKRV